MKKILAVAMVLAMFATLVACEASKGDLTSINDYVAPNYTEVVDTGYFTFAEAGGNTAVITGYVGKAEAHAVVVPAQVTVASLDENDADPEDNIRKVVGIANNAFYYCTAMTSVELPSTIESIGDWAFAGCIGLTEVTIPDTVTTIGRGAFHGCDQLTSIKLPAELLEIKDFAFYGCSALTAVDFPAKLSTIGSAAFFGCQGLTELVLPASITAVGEMAFYKCNYLTKVDMSATSTEKDTVAFSDYIFWSELKDVTTTIQAPEGCVVIGVFVVPENSDAFTYIDSMDNTHIGGIETEDETEVETETETGSEEATTEAAA